MSNALKKSKEVIFTVQLLSKWDYVAQTSLEGSDGVWKPKTVVDINLWNQHPNAECVDPMSLTQQAEQSLDRWVRGLVLTASGVWRSTLRISVFPLYCFTKG